MFKLCVSFPSAPLSKSRPPSRMPSSLRLTRLTLRGIPWKQPQHQQLLQQQLQRRRLQQQPQQQRELQCTLIQSTREEFGEKKSWD
jgi:hypothetical protein